MLKGTILHPYLTPKSKFMSHETLFAIVVISIIGLAFILAKLTGSAEKISKY